MIGCALAARAAAELHAGAGIDSYTVDGMLADLDRPDPGGGLAPGSVLVVDEAAMVGTRKLARLLDHAERAGAKLVLVGDHHQLPEIDAGGVFRGLVDRLPVIELTDNRRQQEAWERDALDELRAGDAAAALAAYTDAGRVVVGDTAEAVRERLVTDWWAARGVHDGSGEPGVMIAARVADVEDLNDRARVRLVVAGELTGPPLPAAGRQFQVGDRIVCLRNDRRLGVVNGTRARVTVVQPDTGTLTARAYDGRTVVLPRGYLEAGHVAHGYAITGHKAQGLTTAQAWVLGSDAIYREWGYVAMSRGRHSNRLYVVAGADTEEEGLHGHGSGRTGEATADLAQALRRTRAQQLAIDHADAASTPRHPRVEDTAAGRGTLRARVHAAVSPAPSSPRERLERKRRTAVDQADTVRQRLEAVRRRADGFKGVRRLLHRGDARAAHSEIARLSGDLRAWERRIADLDAALERSGKRDTGVVRDVDPPQWTRGEARALALRHAVEAAEFDPPDHVLAVFGPRPHGPADRPAWRRAVRAIEGYRATWGVTDAARSLGDVPADPVRRRAYDDALAALRGAQRQLAVDNPQEVMRPASRSSNDLGVEIG